MKLVRFGVQRFRSIEKAESLPVQDGVTVLLGPNNEGKSNLLLALVAAMEIVKRLDRITVTVRGRIGRPYFLEQIYSWERDYSIPFQAKNPSGETHFDLEFELTTAEIADFKKEVGSTLNGTLPLRISMGKGEPTFSVRKPGPAKKALAGKRSQIAEFVGKRIDFQYIPALRSAKNATNIVQDLLERQLRALETNEDYRQALDKVAEIQAPLLKELSTSVCETLKAFLPSVQDVTVKMPQEARTRSAAESCEVVVDDGVPTPLNRKGDGVQSLAALGLMRFASQRGAAGRHLILAVEEPESHLHPAACRRLKEVLQEISKHQQVILTTHNPVFVQRDSPRNNILVRASRASCADTMAEIRDALGVSVSDNLSSADVVLLVEGEDDRQAISAIGSALSPKFKAALEGRVLAVDSLLGGGNLAYKIAQIRDSLCGVHCFLDADVAGLAAAKKAISESLVSADDVTHASAVGMTESELEDLYDPKAYESFLKQTYGLKTQLPVFTSTKQKWSTRMARVFAASGATWDDATKAKLKKEIASLIAANPGSALSAARRGPIDRMIMKVEALVTAVQ